MSYRGSFITVTVSCALNSPLSQYTQDDADDNLAALERTFLGYLRTGLAFSILGIVIAQLFRLEHTEVPQPFGFFILGIPLACICIGAAVVITLLGAYRFWRQQNAMVRGKVHAGGWELTAVGVTAVVVRIPYLYQQP